MTVKKKAKEIMGRAFKTFKGNLYKFVKEDKQLNFKRGEHTKQRDFWEEFKSYKLSEEPKAASDRNKANSLKAKDPHPLGSRGYIRKILEWDMEV